MYENFLGFALFMFLCSATPGPNNILLTVVGKRLGVWGGLPFLSGTALGIAVLGFVFVCAVGGMLSFLDYAGRGVRVLGGGVLLWIAWKIATGPVGKQEEEMKGGPVWGSLASGFIEAFLLQLVNPKVWAVSLSSISTYYSVHYTLLGQALLFAVTFGTTMVMGGFAWLSMGAALSVLLRDAFVARLFNVSMAVLMVISLFPVLVMG